MLKAILARTNENDKQTLGNFILFNDSEVVFSAKSLELPWLDNEKNISCIPVGEYICKRRKSVRFGHHFIVNEKRGGHVSGREFILIHKGNFHSDIKGCLLLGREHLDINNDGYKDVTCSRDTMKKLNDTVTGISFSLKVIDIVRS